MSTRLRDITFRASSAHPCPVCGSGTKGCSGTDNGLHLCRGDPRPGWKRVKRGEPFNSYRQEGDDRHKGNGPPRAVARPKGRDWAAIARGYAKVITDEQRRELATHLQLPVESLAAFPLLGFTSRGHKQEDGAWVCAWTFPLVGAAENVIGINRRFPRPVSINGGKETNKAVMSGGQQGLNIPAGWQDRPGPLLLVEGASDVLAASMCGLSAVGRPSNVGGVEHLAGLLRDLPADRLVITVGENDEKADGSFPGRDGARQTARQLAEKLGRRVDWAMPPDGVKDIRAWVIDLTSGAGESVDWPAIGRTVVGHLVATAKEQADGKTPPARLFSRALAEVESRAVEWVWTDRLPLGMLTILDGDPAHGKSLISLDIAARFSRGWNMPRCDDEALPEPGGVLLLAAEDSAEHTIRPRADAAGADLTLIRVSETIRIGKNERPIRLPDDIEALEREMKEHQIRLLVIDPFLGFLSQAIDSHKDQSVRDVLHQLKLLAGRTGAEVLALRHLGKAGAGNALYRGLGSIAITAAARVVITVGEHPSEQGVRVMATTKNNLSKTARSLTYRIVDDRGQPIIRWGEECDITANDLGVSTGRERGEAGYAAKEFLRDLLANGPKRESEVNARAEAADISEATVRRAKKSLKVRSRKLPTGPWVWELPVEGAHADGGPEGAHPIPD
ncbi:MAG TPA: AAA family ATPase [Gemmataceae bacterium]|nr:AAA family ATPase [Gemmataceae bacterium]